MRTLQRGPGRTFILLDTDGSEMGSLTYPKWWSSKAEVIVAEGVLEVSGKGFWGITQQVKLQNMPLLEIRFPWKGGAVIERAGRPEATLHCSKPSIWRSRYHVRDVQGRERLAIHSKASWRHTDHMHTLEAEGGPRLEPLEILLVVHAINMLNRRAATAASG